MKQRLMPGLVFFLLGGCCGALCHAQDRFIITERHQDFIVTDRIDEPAVIKEVQIKNWKPKQSATDDEFYVIMFKSKTCSPCVGYVNSGKWDNVLKRFSRSRIVDINDEPQYKMRVPSFWLARTNSREVVKQWTGATDVSAFESEVTRIRSNKSGTTVKTRTVTQSRNPSLFGRSGTSHESRGTLIHHLAYEGIHRGKWSIAELHGMSDDALDALHSKDHGWK